MRHDVDVMVAGGGPAGAVCALQLARSGFSVTLIERGGRARNKACGHCLNPRAMRLIERLGLLADTRALAAGCTRLLAVHAPPMTPWQLSLTERVDETGLIVPRDRFDQMLRDAAASAGALVTHEATVQLESRDDDAVTVRVRERAGSTRITCRLLIAADGLGSAIARAAGFIDRDSAGRKYGFSFDWPASASGADASDIGCIDMFLTDAGYLGMVRTDDGQMHLAALVSADSKHTPRDPAAFIRAVAARHTRLSSLGLGTTKHADLHAFCAAGPMPWRPQRIADASVALVGDAAGYIEPFTGEGMTWAIHSAILLADTAAQHGWRWDSTVAKAYRAAWRATVQHQQWACRAMSGILERPTLSRWVFRLGRAAPMIARRVMREVVTP